jgi:formylglycine-generating enzyme required for sulfatase activity
MKMRLIPPGDFKMGPGYQVRLTRPYRLGIHEVTVGQFRAFVKETGHKTEAETNGKADSPSARGGLEDPQPSYNWKNLDFSPGEDYAVVFLSWEDAAKFCDWLSTQERKNYRLPTEAEWEWACRAGSMGKYHFGDDPKDLDAYAWHLGNSGGSRTLSAGRSRMRGAYSTCTATRPSFATIGLPAATRRVCASIPSARSPPARHSPRRAQQHVQ